MSIYIPMTRMTRVPVVDFHKVAPHGDFEVIGCPNPKAKLGSSVQLSGFGNSSASPVTCRAEQNGDMVLCDACHAQYQQAKVAMEGGDFGDDFTYFADDGAELMEPKSFKDRAMGWAKEHPVLVVAGTVVAAATVIGVVAGLGSYLSRSSAASSGMVKGDTNPETNSSVPTKSPRVTEAPAKVVTSKKDVPQTTKTAKPVVPKPAKPTSKATTLKVTEPAAQTPKQTTLSEEQARLTLELGIYNAQNVQDLNVKTVQTFKDGTSKEEALTVPQFGETKLVFDINAKRHKNVKVSYTNNFNPTLRDDGNFRTQIPTTYDFDESLLARGAGKFTFDKNGDGKINAAHTLYVNDGHYVLNRAFEDANGKAMPPVTTKPMNLFIKSESTDPVNLKIGVQRNGRWVDTRKTLNYGQYASVAISPATRRLTSAIGRDEIASYWASNLPKSADGNMCLLLNSASIANNLPLTEGDCGIMPTSKAPVSTAPVSITLTSMAPTSTTSAKVPTKAPTVKPATTTTTAKAPTRRKFAIDLALRNKMFMTNASLRYWINDKSGRELYDTVAKCFSIMAHAKCSNYKELNVYPSQFPLKVSGYILSASTVVRHLEFSIDGREGYHAECYHIWGSGFAGTTVNAGKQDLSIADC